MADWPNHGRIDGPLVMIGFGSIGKGVLPLIERHFEFDSSRFVVVGPDDRDRRLLDERGVRFIKAAVTRENYRELLTPLLTAGGGRGFCVNLSVDTSSLDIMRLCRELGALYIDTVVEPWPGFYFDKSAGPEQRTNNALREHGARGKGEEPRWSTAVSCCGANPGMVSWFVKQALLDIAKDTGDAFTEPGPDDREGWARLMRDLGVKGIHIAERDTQRARNPKPMGMFVNTWSVEGFLSEGMQPAELGWGTHEKWLPENGRLETIGSKAGVYLLQPGANTRVRSWCPTPGAQYGFLVTHNESISIADYFTVRDGDKVGLPADLPLRLPPGQRRSAVAGRDVRPSRQGAGEASHPRRGRDRRRHRRARRPPLRPHEERLLVRLAALDRGDPRPRAVPERDRPPGDLGRARRHGLGAGEPGRRHRRGRRDGLPPLPEVQLPYLGPVKGYYTDWTPLTGRPGFFPEDIDPSDPWQFRNVLVR